MFISKYVLGQSFYRMSTYIGRGDNDNWAQVDDLEVYLKAIFLRPLFLKPQQQTKEIVSIILSPITIVIHRGKLQFWGKGSSLKSFWKLETSEILDKVAIPPWVDLRSKEKACDLFRIAVILWRRLLWKKCYQERVEFLNVLHACLCTLAYLQIGVRCPLQHPVSVWLTNQARVVFVIKSNFWHLDFGPP